MTGSKHKILSALMCFFIMMVAAMACLFELENAEDLTRILLSAGILLGLIAANYRISIILFTQKRE